MDAPSVLLVDDGELDDIAGLLGELGAEVTRLRGGEIPLRIDSPRTLFVATSRRASLADGWPCNGDTPTKIAVVTEDSNTLRAMLRRQGFDLLVRRPVHPYALRLILLHALYAGDERRRSLRVAVGHNVSFRSGFRRHPATLTDLSVRGCGLLVDRPVSLGSRLTVQIPKELTGASSLSIRAKVARIRPARTAGAAQNLGLVFERLSPSATTTLQKLVRSLRFGPPTNRAGHVPSRPGRTSPRTQESIEPAPGSHSPARSSTPTPPPTPQPEPARTPIAAAASEEERRKQRRFSYTEQIVRLDDEAHHVLIGRDISRSGMRVEAHPDLQPGSPVRLAVYGDAREEPFVVEARVNSNYGAAGVYLAFDGLDADCAKRIEAMVARLPALESLAGGEEEGMGSVVSHILASEAPASGGASESAGSPAALLSSERTR